MRKIHCQAAMFAALVLMTTSRAALAQSVVGYNALPGYSATALELSGSAFAVAPDGKFAVAQDDFSGNATITVYDRFEAGRAVLKTFEAPSGVSLQFISGIAWRDAESLVFSENGSAQTVFSASLSAGTATPIAPLNSLPGVAQIAFAPDGQLYAGVAGGPGANAVYTITNDTVNLFASGLGSGYLGGLAFRPADGALFVGDTNDPFFQGNPGMALRLNPDGSLAETLSLAGGNGSGLYDIAFDAASNLYATTGSTLTRLPFGATTAQNFGTFSGPFPFPTELDFLGGAFAPFSGGSGRLLVNGQFTEVGGLFVVQPAAVPEISGFWLLVSGFWSLSRFTQNQKFRTRKRKRVGVWKTLAVFQSGIFNLRQTLRPTRASVPRLSRVIMVAALLFWGTEAAQGQFATQVWAYNSAGAASGFANPVKALGAPSTLATPSVPDNSSLVSVGAAGFLILGFDTPIRRNHARADGFDFIIFGNAFYVGGDSHLRYQEPGTVEVGLDLNGNGYDAGDPFYLLRGSANPASNAPFAGVDDREATTWGYADVTPTNGSGNPLIPDDPFTSGISAGSAGGDVFSLLWAVDAEGNPVTLASADFIRIRAAGNWNTEVDAVALLPSIPSGGRRLPPASDDVNWVRRYPFGAGRRFDTLPVSVPEPGSAAMYLSCAGLSLWGLRRRLR